MARRLEELSPIGVRIVTALNGRSQVWLSEVTGIPKQTLNNSVVRGAMLHADNAILVARALHMSVEWLILGEGQFKPKPGQTSSGRRRAPSREGQSAKRRPQHVEAAPQKPSFWRRLGRLLGAN